MVTVQTPPASMYRSREGLGVWEHKGKVAAVGIGHSPTARRWDERVETSIGTWTIMALRNAMEDAGITPDQVDGMVVVPAATTGDRWYPTHPVPEDFANTYELTDNLNDGLSSMSVEWILKNMPELTNVQFAMHAPTCMSDAVVVAAQAVGDGLTNTCLVLKSWNNLSGRYGHEAGNNALDTAPGASQWTNPWGFGAAASTFAYLFDQYCRKYGKNHDMMAPFVVNEKRNGLLFPEGFWAQHRPEPLTIEDYLSARWVAKPANLFDCDLPIQVVCAYVFTTARTGEGHEAEAGVHPQPRLRPDAREEHNSDARRVRGRNGQRGPQALRGRGHRPQRPLVREHVRRLHAVPPVPHRGAAVRRHRARGGP